MSSAVATRKGSEVGDGKRRDQNLVAFFENHKDDFKQVLAGDIDTFMRTLKNAVIRDPKIAEADTQSVFLEVQKAAQDGLVLDGREAVLTRFNTKYKDDDGKWRYKTAVAYIPMIYGIRKRVMNSGMIKMWTVGLVHQAEYEQGRFKFLPAELNPIYHEPMLVGDLGPVIAAYSLARLSDNTCSAEVMTIAQLNAIRERSKSRDRDGNITGPWKTDIGEMYKKTVARRHSKVLPMSDTDRRIVERVDNLYDFQKNDEDIYDDPPIETPAPVANKQRTSAAATLKKAQQQQQRPKQEEAEEVEHDEETGEILDGDIVEEDDDTGNGARHVNGASDPDDPF